MAIDIPALEAMFCDIREKTDWNIDGPMLWGYFFTDSSPVKLGNLRKVLEREGYSFVDLFVPELDEGQDEYYFLHMERIESHSVLSLHERNQHFYALAADHGIGTYDGMDVGPTPALDA
ncbi:ribonuclease E inhibitor RraB [Pseudoxanthomonas sp. 22568]|uniref:ribonuclease E inhibitor RraB n=1 Tax=unclassified Pseudoxanthomonas TaxID=2645906 RepID=UPI00114162D8|nr:ribonuclease E inhibitor RraB [Pseudoxanthomonas sp. z9]